MNEWITWSVQWSPLHVGAALLGHTWLFVMLLRVPAVYREGIMFRKMLITLRYRGSKFWLTAFRFCLPNLINSPSLLLMHGSDALRPNRGTDIYQACLFLSRYYGPGGPYGDEQYERDPEPEKKENPIPPLTRQLQLESVDEVLQRLNSEDSCQRRLARQPDGDAEQGDLRPLPGVRSAGGLPASDTEGSPVQVGDR